MRLIFAGTPAFAATQLAALRAAGHEIVLVLTQPDRPAGRGLRPSVSAVKEAALSAGLTIRQPPSLKDPALQEELNGMAAEAWVVAAYGLILPPAILDRPRFGCLNVHASLLPRWRGAAPIQRAIMAGDPETGISIMRMDAGLDTGPVLLQRSTPILAEETAGSLHDRLAGLGAALIVEALERLLQGTVVPVPQPATGATYAAKLTHEDVRVDWKRPAESVARMIRALEPTPGAQARLEGQMVKLWHAKAHDTSTDQAPGTVLGIGSDGIRIACGHGELVVTELQRSGGKRLPFREFVRGFAVRPGERFAT
jgi:methionyl-tRNA formyltransferase